MHNSDTTPSRAGKVTRRTVAAGAVWSAPAVIMATPASATAIVSGTYSWRIVTSETTANNGKTVTVAVTVTNYGKAFSITSVTQSGYSWSKGSTTVTGAVVFVAQNIPAGDFETNPPNTTQSFNIVLQGGNDGGGNWTYGTLTLTWSGGTLTIDPPNPTPGVPVP